MVSLVTMMRRGGSYSQQYTPDVILKVRKLWFREEFGLQKCKIRNRHQKLVGVKNDSTQKIAFFLKIVFTVAREKKCTFFSE